MAETRRRIGFLLNGDLIELSDIGPDQTLLDFLRLDRRLRGTKEGCAEGDCGACTVLVGRLAGDGVAYEAVTACIRFLGSLDGCHVVTVEHLAGRDGTLHPVQQAIVDFHGSQCGFCTPGFVMSLYALWMREPEPSDAAIEKALQGNLCRCTGYEAIMRAARAMGTYGRPGADRLAGERASVVERLRQLQDGARVDISGEQGRLIVPVDVDDLADILIAEPGARIVAGSTDVGLWVTKHMRDISPAVFIGHLDGLKGMEERDGALVIGAGVSYSAAHSFLANRLPQLARLIDRIGGEQVRNMGTVGGNIANGSPIGDMPPALISLGARLTLRRGSDRRTIALEDYFIDYGKQDRHPGEFVESVEVPQPPAGAIQAVHKVSKRRDEDITAVLGAFLIEVEGGAVRSARIAFGGMAATPKRARAVEAALVGKPWSMETVEAALPAFEQDFSPISDMRASAAYRMQVAKNLLRRVFLESQDGDAPVSVMSGVAA
jgi:xanthine dehydrogenase small subunit